MITGYTAAVDPERAGPDIMAFVRLRHPADDCKPFHGLCAVLPEVPEAHRVTGEDRFVLLVAVRSMADPERAVGRIAGPGSVTTGVVYSGPLSRRAVAPGEE
ncbi:Lrp/AsnC family transcriptional regulator [Nocardiopsis composta]|uniref:DNA-binding Lrp family transcriptional regulator n=1 Tax=Nocardiopsis composta TaxID=157465 RepID=A0A7W8VFS7_9ACTN|nr:Lrp/AsnC family transcriptional regulator [Nocardiopsis composta]MBB5434727.1 DNA-binding Lrp family transcriptional regulator [Nocardiopsis composta]